MTRRFVASFGSIDSKYTLKCFYGDESHTTSLGQKPFKNPTQLNLTDRLFILSLNTLRTTLPI